MIIFAEPAVVDFLVSSVKQPNFSSQPMNRLMNLTCTVSRTYPQPTAILKRTTEWGTIQDLSRWAHKVVTWFNGSYHLKTSIILPILDKDVLSGKPYLLPQDLLHCEIWLESTYYKRILTKSLPRVLGLVESISSSRAELIFVSTSVICITYIIYLST
ncbi:uncharacterized protein LOC111714210 [Eurytemora carolleeae]|uniref:uncharacterized protein LOC111714210 n=1 Tax=Eurytemora carolleeae TaxID=1294199 RepID=UPI000C767416|nr:uncharacterized protein LOC111714210 [Eurytemora carolleeae]|eukprot:XP_023345039.1 uncharacterized protein LOC111714210 [Eurytemora affinis]